jgi:hypothetical protein
VGPPTLRLPFELGQPFLFKDTLDLKVFSDLDPENIESGAASANLTFNLLEADGVTPVAVFAVPEVSELPLLCIGLLALGVVKGRLLNRGSSAT